MLAALGLAAVGMRTPAVTLHRRPPATPGHAFSPGAGRARCTADMSARLVVGANGARWD